MIVKAEVTNIDVSVDGNINEVNITIKPFDPNFGYIVENEQQRIEAELLREQNTSTAIENANEAASLATEVATHPDTITDGYWYKWNTDTDQYENTNIKANGDSAYEQALEGGYSGTIEQFYEGLAKVSDTSQSIGGFSNNLYLSNTDSGISGVKVLTYTPDETATMLSVSVSSTDGNKLAFSFIHQSPVEVNQMPSGLWSFFFYGYISSSVGATYIGIRPYRYSSIGVKTYLFSEIVWSKEINNELSAIDWLQFSPVIKSLYSVDPTDLLGVDVFVKTSGQSRTVYFNTGDGNCSYLNSPITLRHNQLRAQNQESNYQHFDSTVEKATPLAADSLGLWDTITSTFKKLSLTNLITFLSGSFLTLSQDVSQNIGTTIKRVAKGWFSDIDISNMPTISGVSISNLITKIVNSTENNSKLEATATGLNATRNVADANAAMKLELVNPSSTANISEYRFANVLVASIDKNGLYSGGIEQTTANKNKYLPLIKDTLGNIIAKRFTYYWNGSAYVVDYSNGFGHSALQNNTGISSNGFGHSALQNNTGSSSNGFGYAALQNNTGIYSNGFGLAALYNNTGSSSNGFGYTALYNNTGSSSNGFGHSALQNNTGSSSNGFGYTALYNNTGSSSNGFGYLSLYNNTGASSNGFGLAALYNNTGSYSNGFGYAALRYNQKDNNTALGYNSYAAFIDNVSGNKTVAYTNVDISLDRITINSHGFGATNAYVNIKYASTDGVAIGGLTVATIYQVKIIDANTIEFRTSARGIDITSQGTGNHVFTPQYAYTNVTCLGANTNPTKDNQVVLGDANVIEVTTAGTYVTPKSAINKDGGIMVKLTNKTGATTVIGTVVAASDTTDNAFKVNPVNGDMPIGVVYEVVDADAECWIVVSGIAQVLLVNSVATTRSYIGYSSSTVAGRIDTSASVPAAITHFREIGHTLESKIAGANVLVKMIIHFN